MMESYGSNQYYVTDLDEDRSREHVAQQALDMVGNLLEGASRGLEELQDNDLLGAAIVRKSQELADMIGNLAIEIGNSDQRELARACLKDLRHQEQEENQLAPHAVSEQQMIEALSGAQSLLVDVEASLRSIGQDEADEIADVALIVAQLFLASAQSVYETITPQQLAGTYIEESNRVELLDDGVVTASRSLEPAAPVRKQSAKVNRVRVLWPPIGPHVESALKCTRDAAARQPLLAAALGLTLWPAAVVTALFGTPLVMMDSVVQGLYNQHEDSSIIRTVEIGAAQLFHASRLTLLCSGLVYKQTLRVAKRQLERHGGIGQVFQDVGGFCLDRATHPVETIGQTWEGLSFAALFVRDAALTVHDAASREMEREMDKTCQSLD